MAATGFGFAAVHGFWPLLLVAFIGTLNPSGGDVSVFLPLEHTVLAHTASDKERTAMFAHYSFAGAAVGALGALAAGVVDWFAPAIAPFTTINILFVLYGLLGLLTFVLYQGLSPAVEAGDGSPPVPLGPSRRRVYGLAALFSIDAFGGASSSMRFWRSGCTNASGSRFQPPAPSFSPLSFAPRCPISLRCRSRDASGLSIRWCSRTFPPTSSSS